MPKFLWLNGWMGVFYDAQKRRIYLCPVPLLVFQLENKTQREYWIAFSLYWGFILFLLCLPRI